MKKKRRTETKRQLRRTARKHWKRKRIAEEDEEADEEAAEDDVLTCALVRMAEPNILEETSSPVEVDCASGRCLNAAASSRTESVDTIARAKVRVMLSKTRRNRRRKAR